MSTALKSFSTTLESPQDSPLAHFRHFHFRLFGSADLKKFLRQKKWLQLCHFNFKIEKLCLIKILRLSFHALIFSLRSHPRSFSASLFGSIKTQDFSSDTYCKLLLFVSSMIAGPRPLHNSGCPQVLALALMMCRVWSPAPNQRVVHLESQDLNGKICLRCQKDLATDSL